MRYGFVSKEFSFSDGKRNEIKNKVCVNGKLIGEFMRGFLFSVGDYGRFLV